VSDEFDEKVVEDWIERIPSKRLQTITRVQMSRILEEADREASVGYSSKVRAWSIGMIRIVIRDGYRYALDGEHPMLCTTHELLIRLSRAPRILAYPHLGSGGSRFEPWPASHNSPVQDRCLPWKRVPIPVGSSSITMTRVPMLVSRHPSLTATLIRYHNLRSVDASVNCGPNKNDLHARQGAG